MLHQLIDLVKSILYEHGVVIGALSSQVERAAIVGTSPSLNYTNTTQLTDLVESSRAYTNATQCQTSSSPTQTRYGRTVNPYTNTPWSSDIVKSSLHEHVIVGLSILYERGVIVGPR